MKKYIKTFESFRSNEPVNEEFLGAIGKFFKNMFKKAQENIRKTEGGQEVEEIYKKYLKLIDDAIVKQTGLNLDIAALPVKESKVFEAEEAEVDEAETPTATKSGSVTDEKKPEEDKIDPKLLKEKSALIAKTIEQMKGMAAKEMDDILKKHGGGSKNPELQIIINAKKSQFTLDVMNAKIAALEKSEDPESKKAVEELTKEAEPIKKQIKDGYDKLSSILSKKTKKPVEYKEGDTVIYKRNDFKEEEWKKLSDEDKTNKDKWEEVQVGSKSITKIDGENFTFKDKDDKDITKPISDILLKVKVKEETKESDTEDKANKLMDKEQEEAKAAGEKSKVERASEDNKEETK